MFETEAQSLLTIRLLALDNHLNEVGRHWKKVDVVCTRGGIRVDIGLDGGNVRVHQDDLAAALLKRLDGLAAAVVELAGLANR